MSMKQIILIFLFLLPVSLFGQQFQYAVRYGYHLTSLPTSDPKLPETLFESLIGRKIGFEYTFLVDNNRRYNGNFQGLTAGFGVKYENFNLNNFQESTNINNRSIQLPLYWAIKENEWNTIYKFGLIYQYDYETNIEGTNAWKINPNHLNIFGSLGFDNEPYSYRRDWSYHIGVFGEYSLTSYVKDEQIRVLNWGVIVGLSYIIDYYHYRGKTYNRPIYD